MTWVHGNHTFKAGADMVLEGFPQQSSIRAYGEYGFSGQQTENPAEYGVGGIVFPSGFPYASFLLGQTNYVETSAINDTRLGNHTWGAFIQDSWKVSRRLTLELGVRWDYATLLSEEHGAMSDACFTCVNPALASAYNPGGRAGAIVYGATNNGPLSDSYKFGLGPHVGVAYQITPKTVFRAGGSSLTPRRPTMPSCPIASRTSTPSARPGNSSRPLNWRMEMLSRESGFPPMTNIRSQSRPPVVV